MKFFFSSCCQWILNANLHPLKWLFLHTFRIFHIFHYSHMINNYYFLSKTDAGYGYSALPHIRSENVYTMFKMSFWAKKNFSWKCLIFSTAADFHVPLNRYRMNSWLDVRFFATSHLTSLNTFSHDWHFQKVLNTN